MTFAARLEKIMNDRGFNQTDSAMRSNVGQPAISMMLKRECRPRKRTILRLAEALEVAPEERRPGFEPPETS
ncbi:MAG: helix-turn-helix domain-containing protein [Planctomycetia bacterium]